jgi:hypothetical protein
VFLFSDLLIYAVDSPGGYVIKGAVDLKTATVRDITDPKGLTGGGAI